MGAVRSGIKKTRNLTTYENPKSRRGRPRGRNLETSRLRASGSRNRDVRNLEPRNTGGRIAKPRNREGPGNHNARWVSRSRNRGSSMSRDSKIAGPRGPEIPKPRDHGAQGSRDIEFSPTPCGGGGGGIAKPRFPDAPSSRDHKTPGYRGPEISKLRFFDVPRSRNLKIPEPGTMPKMGNL